MDTPSFAPLTDAEQETMRLVAAEFPFPLALTCLRVTQSLAREPLQPVESAWRVRDAFECLVKFVAYVAVADFLACAGEHPNKGKIAEVLMNPRGLVVGSWIELLQFALMETVPDRRLPDLRAVFYTPGNKSTALKNRLGDFAHWRNDVFGHGIFQQQPDFYEQQALTWLHTLIEYYTALTPVFARRQLAQMTPGGEVVLWQGAQNLTEVGRHEHEAMGTPISLILLPSDPASAAPLPLGPLLTLQECKICRQPAAFFYDRFRGDVNTQTYKAVFREYFEGHKHDHPHASDQKRDPNAPQSYDALTDLASHLPPGYVWERDAYDQDEVARDLEEAFKRSEKTYLRPDYLADWFWQTLDDLPKGYLYLVGEEGLGKSYFVTGLQDEDAARYARVLPYHILPGPLADFRTFITELRDTAAKRMKWATQEVPTNVPDLRQQHLEMASFLRTLKDKNNLSALIIAIDALDELSDPEPGSRSIADLLPPPALMPDGCFFLLTSRPALRPKIAAAISALRHDTDLFVEKRIGAGDADNQDLIRQYLRHVAPGPDGQRTATLPERFRNDADIEAIAQRSRSVFLYAFHLARGLNSGAFADTDALPDGAQFYPVFLERLRTHAGDVLFETVYLRLLLLLCAARQPVTLDQLMRWGLPEERLSAAISELRDFLTVRRGLPWIDRLTDEDDGELRYALAHEAFVRFIESDERYVNQLRSAHFYIATALIEHQGVWAQIDEEKASELYDLRYAVYHYQQFGIPDYNITIYLGEGYAEGCQQVGYRASGKTRYRIGLELYDQSIAIVRDLVSQGRVELNKDLARAVMNKGVTLGNLTRYAEAVTAYDEAIIIYRLLVSQGRTQLSNDLAMMVMNRANVLQALTRYAEAVNAYDEAIGIYRLLVYQGRMELSNDLAMMVMNKANAFTRLALYGEAVTAYDEAISIYRLLVSQGRTELGNELAAAVMNKGATLNYLTLFGEAVTAYDEAISIYRFLVSQGRTELSYDLAMAVMNKGAALDDLSLFGEAVAAYDEAIGILRLLVSQGRTELSRDLAMAVMNKGATLNHLNKYIEAFAAYDEAIGIYRLLVSQGRTELSNALANAVMNKGAALAGHSRYADAVVVFDEAINVYRLLVSQGYTEINDDLASALMNKGIVLRNLAQYGEATAVFDEAIEIWIDDVKQGKIHLIPNLVKGIKNRLGVHLVVEGWQNVADDLALLYQCLLIVSQEGLSALLLKPDLDVVAQNLYSLPDVSKQYLRVLLDEYRSEFFDWLIGQANNNTP